MKLVRNSLFAKIFAAIAATAFLIVAVMALMVALSMRDGFAQYLLKGELARFDDLAAALARAHQSGWPDLVGDPRRWHDFVGAHLPRRGPGFEPPPGPPPGPLLGSPPPRGPGIGARIFEDRLVLLDPDGKQIAGAFDRSALFERRPICATDDCTGPALLGYVGLKAPEISGNATDAFFLRGQYASLAFSALIAIAVSAGAAFLVARQFLVPIRRLETGAKTLASGTYTARIKQDRSDELGRLIDHYNTLAATLERTDKAEREWISNTSHELQTPLAVLRAQIEALQDGIRQPDPKTLSEMHAAMMRLSRLVTDLKMLSYAREAEQAINRAAEDLSEIVRMAAEAAGPQLTKKGVDLVLDLPDCLPLRCDREQIGQVIDNLLQNASRYTDAPGRVRLVLSEENGFAQIAVDDTPPGVPDDDLPKLFDRFYRVEASRSRIFGGSGLGLSVCKAIIEAHGGSIIASQSNLGGLHITIRLPKGVA